MADSGPSQSFHEPRQSKKTDKFRDYEKEKMTQSFKSAVANFRRLITRITRFLGNSENLDIHFFDSEQLKLTDSITKVRSTFSSLDVEDQEYDNLKDVLENSETEYSGILMSIDNHVFMMQDYNYDIECEPITLVPGTPILPLASKSRESVSSKISRRSVQRSSSNYSCQSQLSNDAESERLRVSAEAAALKVRLQFFEKELVAKNELERLQLQRDLSMAEAKQKAMDEIVMSDSNNNASINCLQEQTDKMAEGFYPEKSNVHVTKLQRDEHSKITKSKEVDKDKFGDFSKKSRSQDQNEKFEEMIQVMTNNTNLNRLPIPEPQIFSGNLLEFPRWKTSVQTLINNRGIPEIEKIHYLIKYVGGETKTIVDGYMYSLTESTYSEVMAVLEDRYGDNFRIANAFRSKLDRWPKIQDRDALGLQAFSDFLQQLNVASKNIKSLKVLNDERENQKMLQKMPNWLIISWGKHVRDYRKSNDDFPPFAEFAGFVKSEAKQANDPIVSIQSVQASMVDEEDVHTFTTETNQGKVDKIQIKKPTCLFCDSVGHHLDECRKFLSYSVNERKHFVWTKGICFGCLSKNHRSKECHSKLKCKFCNKDHPSSLHTNGRRPRGQNQGQIQGQDTKGHILSSGYDHMPQTPNLYNNKREEVKQSETGKPDSQITHKIKGVSNDSLCNQECKSTMIVPVLISHPTSHKEIMVYALLDTQSNCSFILESVMNDLDVKGIPTILTLSTMTDVNKKVKSHKVNGLMVRGRNLSEKIELPAMYTRGEIPANKSNIPTPERVAQWPHLKEIATELAPISDAPIGLLIGCNCPMALQPLDTIRSVGNQPFAQRSVLGWGVIGMLNHHQTPTDEVGLSHRIICSDNTETKFVFKTSVKEIVTPAEVQNMMSLDFCEYDTDDKDISFEDKRFLNLMKECVHLRSDGHYEMPLPLKDAEKIFPNNRSMAFRRFQCLLAKFRKDEKYKADYIKFMNDIIEKGLAEKVPKDELPNKNVWYIPHHGVYNPRKPDKIRVVFDCSAKFQGESLNDNLMSGPDLTNNLVGVLLRFRKESVAFSCDIEQMFYQFYVNAEHRDFLRFLWFDQETNDVSEFRMKVHLFGASSSPSCANFGLKQAADDNESSCGEEAASFIRNEFYVDDGLKSTKSIQSAQNIVRESQNICRNAGLKLHKFVSNKPEVLEEIDEACIAKDLQRREFSMINPTIEKVLGLGWCLDTDTFSFKMKLENKPNTRRGILSTVSCIFDPLGLLSPVILLGKQILQDLCRENIDWDTTIPTSIQTRWEHWKKDLVFLEQIKIARCYKPENFGSIKDIQLHHFSDASNKGYGQCSYLRISSESNQVYCSLVMSKSRVTPIKVLSIPRLELTAAVTSARICRILSRELNYTDVQHYFWTDSKVVLGYVSNDTKRFHVFVANRVQEIRDISDPQQWNYVNTNENPADLASRGLTARELLENRIWFKGPDFLWNIDISDRLCGSDSQELELNDPEVKKAVVHTVLGDQSKSECHEEIPSVVDFNRFSSWLKLKRVFVLCQKFIQKMKTKCNLNLTPDKVTDSNRVTVRELSKAETLIIKSVQQHCFTEELKVLKNALDLKTSDSQSKLNLKKASTLYSLNPFLDSEGIIRVGGRLSDSGDDYWVKHPIVLPKNSHVSKLIVQHFHTLVCHQGRGMTCNIVRSNGFWIIGLRSMVSSMIYKCVICRKNRSVPLCQKMADLPKIRSEESPPFTFCGVDLFGPFSIREGRKVLKRYGVLFTCLASRAIHLDVVNSLTTDAFIQAFRRFCAIRGPVKQLYSDQATNFVGASNELCKLDQNKIHEHLTSQNCEFFEWKFNIPESSYKGGVWERQIRTVRSVLIQILSKQGDQLDDESLRTLMYETMSIVNSRPLSVDNMEDPNFPEPLTPNHILTMKFKILLQPPGQFVNEDLYSRKRWRRIQYLLNVFWSRWKTEYANNLQVRTKWQTIKRNLKVGDIVMLKDEDSPRNQWPLARVIEAPEDEDGLVRHATILCANGKTFQRPIRSLFMILEQEENK